MKQTFILEIPYAGLGDHLFHSHLPRIAKETGKYSHVYISTKSVTWNNDCNRVVWEMNPYVDGFIEREGKSCDLNKICIQLSQRIDNNSNSSVNLLDEIMYAFGLDDGKYLHEPEVYYKPKYIDKYNKIIYDPNFISYTGELNADDVNAYFYKKKIRFDAVMKIRSIRALHSFNPNTLYMETPTLEDFCDLVFSCKEIHCFTTGTATLAPALNRKAFVYYGDKHLVALRHSPLNSYHEISRCKKSRFINLLKTPYRFVKHRLPTVWKSFDRCCR